MSKNKKNYQITSQTYVPIGVTTLSRLKAAPYVLSEEEMQGLYAVTDLVHHNVLTRLVTQYPMLSKTDIRYSCLVILGYTNTEICKILNVSPSAFEKWTKRMKDKIGDDSINIHQFLRNSLYTKKIIRVSKISQRPTSNPLASQ